MRIGIYAIYDKLTEAAQGGLHLFRHDAAAIRFFSDLASDPQTGIHKHTADYELHLVGHLEDDIVRIDPHVDGSKLVITGSTLLEAQAAQRAD